MARPIQKTSGMAATYRTVDRPDGNRTFAHGLLTRWPGDGRRLRDGCCARGIGLGREDPRLQRPAPRSRPGIEAGRDVARRRRRHRRRRLRLSPRGAGRDDRRAGLDRDAGGSRPGQQRDRGRPARRRRRLGGRRLSCTGNPRRSTGVEFFGLGAGIPVPPGTGASTSTTSARGGDAGDCPRGDPRPALPPPAALRHQRAAAITSAARPCSKGSRRSGRDSPSAATSTSRGAARASIGETPVHNLGPSGAWLERPVLATGVTAGPPQCSKNVTIRIISQEEMRWR